MQVVPEYWTVKEIADHFVVSAGTVHKWIHRSNQARDGKTAGRVPPFPEAVERVGGRPIFERSAVLHWKRLTSR
jgi:transposase-like protein